MEGNINLYRLIGLCLLLVCIIRCKSFSTLGQDKYIHSFTSCDGAYGGSLSAVFSVATHSGWLNKLIFDATKTLSLLQTYPSMVWLMPWEQVNKTRRIANTYYFSQPSPSPSNPTTFVLSFSLSNNNRCLEQTGCGSLTLL